MQTPIMAALGVAVALVVVPPAVVVPPVVVVPLVVTWVAVCPRMPKTARWGRERPRRPVPVVALECG